MNDKIKGRCWVADDYVMAYEITTQEFWTTPIDKEENSKWIMSGVKPEFNKENGFKDFGYTFIIAGHNFAGGGKSIEHCVAGLLGAGIKAVFATSFARLQFRNAINYGLPFITSEDIDKSSSTGDEMEYDPNTGEIKNLTTGKVFHSLPAPPFVAEVGKAGGLMNFVREKIAKGEPIK